MCESKPTKSPGQPNSFQRLHGPSEAMHIFTSPLKYFSTNTCLISHGDFSHFYWHFIWKLLILNKGDILLQSPPSFDHDIESRAYLFIYCIFAYARFQISRTLLCVFIACLCDIAGTFVVVSFLWYFTMIEWKSYYC